MTREEAIEMLKTLKEQARNSGANTFVWDINIDSFNFVIDMAIKALEQEPILDKIKQAREEMKECSYSLSCFNEDVFDEDERVVDLDNVLIILDKLIESEDKE